MRTGAVRLLLPGLAALALGGCDQLPVAKPKQGTPTQAAPRVTTTAVAAATGGVEGATPVAERTAVIGLLNKRNGLVRDLAMQPGDSVRVGRALVRLRACEATPPWERPSETAAFVQLIVQNQRDDKWYRIFSGWVFQNRPERNIVEHPIYDVFVKSCTMSFPGGEPVEKSATAAPRAARRSSAVQSPPETSAPAAPAAPTATLPPPNTAE